jgi:hypothetical protein
VRRGTTPARNEPGGPVGDTEGGRGRERIDEIRERFGPEVAGIVEECSDTLEQPKPP